MPISGEEWKYECTGDELTPLKAKNYCATRARILVALKGAEGISETRILETSPDGDFIKLGTQYGFMSGTAWFTTDNVRVLCVLSAPVVKSSDRLWAVPPED